MQRKVRQELEVLEEGIRAMEAISNGALGVQTPLKNLARRNAKHSVRMPAVGYVTLRGANHEPLPAFEHLRGQRRPWSPTRNSHTDLPETHSGKRNLGKQARPPQQSPSSQAIRAMSVGGLQRSQAARESITRTVTSQRQPLEPWNSTPSNTPEALKSTAKGPLRAIHQSNLNSQSAAAASQRAAASQQVPLASQNYAAGELTSTAEGPMKALACESNSRRRSTCQPVSGKSGTSTKRAGMHFQSKGTADDTYRQAAQNPEIRQTGDLRQPGKTLSPTQPSVKAPVERGSEAMGNQEPEWLWELGSSLEEIHAGGIHEIGEQQSTANSLQSAEHGWHRVTTWVAKDSFLATAAGSEPTDTANKPAAREADGIAAGSCQEGAAKIDEGMLGESPNPRGLPEVSAMGSWRGNDAMEGRRKVEKLQERQGDDAFEERQLRDTSEPAPAEADVSSWQGNVALDEWQGSDAMTEQDREDADSLVMRVELKVATRKLALYMRELEAAQADNCHLQEALQLAQEQPQDHAEAVRAECEKQLQKQKDHYCEERERLRAAMADQVSLFRTEMETRFRSDKETLQRRLAEMQDALLAEQTAVVSLKEQVSDTKFAAESEKRRAASLEQRVEELSHRFEEQTAALSVASQQQDDLSRRLEEQTGALTVMTQQREELCQQVEEQSVAIDTANQQREVLSQRFEERTAALSKAQSQNAELRQSLGELSQSRDLEREGRLAAEERSQREVAAMKASQAAVAELRGQLKETRSSLKEARRQADEIQQSAAARLADVILKHEAQLTAEHAAAEAKLRELADRTKRALADESAAAEADFAKERDALLADAVAARREFESMLGAERARCDQARGEAAAHKQRSSALKDALDSLQAELKHERSDAFRKLQDAERKGANEAHRLRQQLNQAKAALESSRSNAKAAQERSSSETHRLQDRLSHAEASLQAARSDAKIAADRASSEVHHLQMRLKDAEVALELAQFEAQANRDRAQAAADAERATQACLEGAGSGIETLRGELEAVKDRLADRERDLLQQLEEWERKHSNDASELARQRQCIFTLRSDLAHAQEAAAAANAQADRGKAEVARATAALSELRDEVSCLRRQQAAVQQEAATAQDQWRAQRYQASLADLAEAATKPSSRSPQNPAPILDMHSEEHALHHKILSLEREVALLAAERDLAVQDMDRTAEGQGSLQGQLIASEAALQETRSALDEALGEATEAVRKNEELSAALAKARANDTGDIMRARDEALQALAVASGRLEHVERRAEDAELLASEAQERAKDAERRVEELEVAARLQGDSMRALAEAASRLAKAEKRARESEERRGAAEQAARLATAERDTLSHRLRSRELEAEGQANAAERAAEEVQAEISRLQEQRDRLQAALSQAHQDKEALARQRDEIQAAADTAAANDPQSMQLEAKLKQAEARSAKSASRNAILDKRIVQLKSLLRTAQSRANCAESNAQAIQAELGSVREMAARSQSTLSGTVAGLEADLKRLHGDLKEAESSRSKADAEGRLQLAEAVSAKDKAKETAKALQEALETAIQEVEGTRMNFAAMRNKATSVPQSPVLLPKDENTWPDIPSARGKDERIRHLRRSLAKANDDITALQASMDSLQRQLAASEQEKDAQVQKAASAQASADAIGRQLSACEDEKKSLIQEAAHKQTACNTLAEKFAMLEDKYCTSAEESASNQHRFEEQLATAFGELSELRSAANTMQAAAERDAATLAEKEQEVARLSAEVARLTNEIQAGAERYAASLAGKEQEVVRLTAEVARLSEDLHAAAEREAASLAEKEQEVFKLTAEIARLSDVMQAAAEREAASLAGKELEVTRLSTELQTATDSLVDTREEVTRLFTELQTATDNLADARKDQGRLFSELQVARDSGEEIARLSSELQAARNCLAAYREEIARLDGALKDAASSHAAVLAAREQEIARLLTALSEATEAHDEAVEPLTAQERKENAHAGERVMALQNDLDRFRCDMEAACSRELQTQEALAAAENRLLEQAETAAVTEAQLAQLHTEKRLADVRAEDLAERLVCALNTEGQPVDGWPITHIARVGASMRSEDHSAGCETTAAEAAGGDCADLLVRSDSAIRMEATRETSRNSAQGFSLEQLAAEDDAWAEVLSDGGLAALDRGFSDRDHSGDVKERHRYSSPDQELDALHESAAVLRGGDLSVAQEDTLVEELARMQKRLALAEAATEKLVAAQAAIKKLEGEGRGKDEQLAKLRARVSQLSAEKAALQEASERQQVIGASDESTSRKSLNPTPCERCMHLTAQLAAAERRAGRLSEDLNRILQQ